MKNIPIIAIDIGGTIEDSWNSKRMWFNSRGYDIGICPMGRREVVYIIGEDESLYEEMLKEVYSDESIICRKPIDDILKYIKILKYNFKIVLLSSRDEEKRGITIEWMKNNKLFEVIDEIIFLGQNGDKLEWCINSRVNIFIDDDIRHLELKDENDSIIRIHYCKCPKKQTQVNSSIFSATKWSEVVNIIQDLSTKMLAYHETI